MVLFLHPWEWRPIPARVSLCPSLCTIRTSTSSTTRRVSPLLRIPWKGACGIPSCDGHSPCVLASLGWPKGPITCPQFCLVCSAAARGLIKHTPGLGSLGVSVAQVLCYVLIQRWPPPIPAHSNWSSGPTRSWALMPPSGIQGPPAAMTASPRAEHPRAGILPGRSLCHAPS